jgi:hypothetical protein
MAASPKAGIAAVISHSKKRYIERRNTYLATGFLSAMPITSFASTRVFVSVIFSNAEWIPSSDHTLLGSAYQNTRIALQREAGLTDADLDTLTDVMGDALLSLYRAGQVNETRLTNYAVAKTLRHISAGQR